jgi:hypothetical protein
MFCADKMGTECRHIKDDHDEREEIHPIVRPIPTCIAQMPIKEQSVGLKELERISFESREATCTCLP